MKKFFTKKALIVTTALSLTLSAGSIAYSATTLKKITAYQNYAIGIEVGGKKVDLTMDGKKLYPITFEGRTYVPARIVADSLGANVQWDDKRQTVVITPEGQTPPKIDTGSSNPGTSTPPSGSASASSNKGTFNDPVKFNTAFTYKELVNYKPEENDTSSADFTVTVTKVVPISLDQIVALGFQRPENNPDIEYRMVSINLKVKNATMKSKDKNGYKFLSSYRPYISGVETPDGHYIIGSTDFGFDGAIAEATREVLPDFPQVTPTTKGSSFEVNGKVLLPIVKGEENYMVVSRSDSTLEYEDRKIFFKLQ
ncbi:copper amine oxidase N-terminal domain-containing protein [Paenibacillus pinisoli]|uniref:Copper amine oxidase N-terminal domain-containing protein n=1 Tax=Paenibacillus pinisoli TaxID=1276110 RepID=A0A3A6PU20_9BACL|nr:copper amine oxidase N-terminal domain-containing protein [Paenibacillus pinisoli]RJX37414.1 copper amine oxidase N-terminal domain-containing protein [Paenibacillus pinisoli]